MKFVQPIKDTKKLKQFKEYLKDRNERDYVMFMVGINTGFRISDILPLRKWDTDGTHITIREKKTGKRKSVKINQALRKALDEYTKEMPGSAYLFTGRSKKHKTGKCNEPITTSAAYKMLSGAAKHVGLEDIGTHSMRKTFGYHFHQREKDITLLMELFNHAEESITLRYIGIKQDTLDEALDRHSL